MKCKVEISVLCLMSKIQCLRPPHSAHYHTQTNGQLPLSDHSVASRLIRSAEKLH